ncbi:hypothetical protein B7463_g5251, partial [Scytalidium lignicola]
MTMHIENNSAAPASDQLGRLKLEPDDILAIPYECLQLAKATELLFHDIPDDLLEQCIPKDVKKYSVRSYDNIFFENALKNHVANISRKTLHRGLELAKLLVYQHINTANFRNVMRDTNEKSRIYYLRDLLTNDHVYYLYSDQWESVSFDFVHHEGLRPIPSEESLRSDLRKFTKLSSAMMLYDIYRHTIQLKAGRGTANEPNVKAGWDFVVVNYKAMPGWGPLGRIVKTLDHLPASPNFTKKKQDYLFQPEPEPLVTTIRSIKCWLITDPSKTFATLQITEGPKDVFGHTAILFGIPTKFVSGLNCDLDFVPYGSQTTIKIWDAHYGFKEWKGFREISQVLFFRHGGLNSWMYRDLLPDNDLHFEGCSSCTGHCYCWWINMRAFRRELEEDIINDRMIFWVARMVEQNSDQLMSVWSNLDEGNPSRRRCIWRNLFRKDDMLNIFEPLRPGVDIQTIVEKEEENRKEGVWKQWLYDSAAWLADDIFAYHVSQGKLGEEVPCVVFDRYARIRDIPQFQYVPHSLESLPIRGNFKCL